MAGQIILRDVICKHNIPVTGYHGNTVHVIIFYDPKTHTTWYWKTQTTDGLRYKEHLSYSIIGHDDGNYKLSRVNEISFDRSKDPEAESEQPDQKLNALDILFPDTHLTYNEKYDIITAKGGERNV